MKAYIVKLPLRTIHLQLQDKEQTALDASGLSSYIELHNNLWEVKQLTEQYREEVGEVQSIVADLKTTFTTMETEVRKYGRTAGFTDKDAEEAFGDMEEGTKVTLKIGYLQSLLDTYTHHANRYDKKRHQPDEFYRVVSKIKERFNELFCSFDRNYFSPMLNGWEHLQIDTISLDDDFNQFKELCTEIDTKHDRTIDEWNTMCEEVKELSSKMEELNKHIVYLSGTLKALRLEDKNSELN